VIPIDYVQTDSDQNFFLHHDSLQKQPLTRLSGYLWVKTQGLKDGANASAKQDPALMTN
jgi:hypothetical protein